VKIVASLLLTTLFAIRPQTRLQSPIESTARSLLTNFASGRFDVATSDFNNDLRPIVTPAVLAQVKAQLDQQVGMFYVVKEAHPRIVDGFRAIELIAKFEKAPVSVVVVFDPLDRVGAVYFNPILEPAVDPALEAVAREVLTNFTVGRYDDAVKPFDPEMRRQLSPAKMAGLAASVADRFGTFVSVTEVHQKLETFRIIDMVLSYTKAPVAYRVTFDGQGRVTALRIAPYVKY
jgi:Protein of unknown function (DUF3887)